MLRSTLTRLSTRFGYAGLPTPLLRDLLLISAVGLALPWIATAVSWQSLSGREIAWTLMLLVMATVSERFQLHLTHKTNINITAAALR